MFEFAISLGFPHPDMMLREMTWSEYTELQHFMRERKRRREELEQQAQESRLRQFFMRLRGRQQQQQEGAPDG